MKKNRIIVLTDESGLSWDSLGLLEQQAEIYLAKGIQDTLSHLTICSYHLILIALDKETEVICQVVKSIRKTVMTPILVLLSENSKGRSRVIHAGADVALIQPYTAEEISLLTVLFCILLLYIEMDQFHGIKEKEQCMCRKELQKRKT